MFLSSLSNFVSETEKYIRILFYSVDLIIEKTLCKDEIDKEKIEKLKEEFSELVEKK